MDHRVRNVALAALAAGAVALAGVVMFSASSSTYTIHARFLNAGQLVDGARVQVAGHAVGSVTGIRLSPEGYADVELRITDEHYQPLRRGTRATIRAVGQAGITNRFVQLTPGPGDAAALADGAVLGTDATRGIVDLDAVIDAFDPKTRAGLRTLLARSADVFAGSGSRYFNSTLAQLSPALEEWSGTASELTADGGELERLVATASRTSAAIASRSTDLEGAVSNTARAFSSVSGERAALSGSLRRLPPVLGRAEGTLRLVHGVLPALRQDLQEVPAAATTLKPVLQRASSASTKLRPVVGQVTGILPDLERSLNGLPALKSNAVPALRATSAALSDSLPILNAVRVYTPDLILGVFGGLGGVASGNYDALGHYGRLMFVESPQAAPSGLLRLLPIPDLPGLKIRSAAVAPCPGGAAEPAPDGSNTWVPYPGLCDLKDNHP